MHADLILSISTLYGFLFVLARMAGVIVFVPLPGMTSAPEAVRVVLAFGAYVRADRSLADTKCE